MKSCQSKTTLTSSRLSSAEYRALPRKNKYRAVKTTVGDFVFASKAEARHYEYLLERFKRGEIRNLELQPKFKIVINGVKVFEYWADFSWFEGHTRVVCDVKGFKTAVYKLKKKIVEAQLGVTIREVKA